MTPPTATLSKPVPPTTVPPLQAGDRLTLVEFERRYAAMPDLKKAELIEGIVYMPSPVSTEAHAAPHFNLIGWLALYGSQTPGVQGGDNATLRLDLDNEPQPDAFLRIRPECGDQSSTRDGYVEGALELVAEIAATSASYDLHDKLNVYRRHGVKDGVKEYIVWRVWDQAIDWFVLREGRYEPLSITLGLYRSEVFPGLWLEPEALLAGDMARVLHIVQEGLQSPQHVEFVGRLQTAR